MLKLYKRTITVSVWIFVVLMAVSIILKILFPSNDTIAFLQNYIIGVNCSILVVIITTFLQYKSEYARVMSEFVSTLQQLILSLVVALSYQEENVEERFCRKIIEEIKDKCDTLNQLSQSFCCFNKKIYRKFNEFIKIVSKLYLPLLSNQDDAYGNVIKEKIDSYTCIELAQRINEFIDDKLIKRLISKLIKAAKEKEITKKS